MVAYYAHLRTSIIMAAIVLIVGTLAKRAYAIYAKRRRQNNADD